MSTDIIIEQGLIKRLSEVRILPEESSQSNHFLLTDSRVDSHYGDLVLQQLREVGYNVTKFVVPEGEASKNIHIFTKLADAIFAHGMSKHSYVISLGGGVVNNIAGVLASTLYRGIGLIHIATSSMSQVDASLDFKQAINASAGKNLIGSYYPADKILIDTEVLDSLDDRHLLNGLSESIKHALTQDETMLSFMLENADNVRDSAVLQKIVEQTVNLKVPLLNGDVEDDYNEMLPQYGHCPGHAIEHLSGYDLLHGEALSIGMCITAEVAKINGLAGDEVVDMHYKVLEAYKLPTVLPKKYKVDDVLRMIRFDKHFVDERAHMALPIKVGDVWNNKGVYGVSVDLYTLERAIITNQSKHE